jgi:hypothetical protein
MGKLVYSLSVSLDGFVETPSRSLDRVLVDEELHSFFDDDARSMSVFLCWMNGVSPPSGAPRDRAPVRSDAASYR